MSGLIPVNIGKVLSTLYEKRQSGDYDDFIYCDKEMTDDLTVQAKTYIDSLALLLKGGDSGIGNHFKVVLGTVFSWNHVEKS